MGNKYLVRQVNPDSYMLCKPLLPTEQESSIRNGGDGYHKNGSQYTLLSLLYRIQTAKAQGDAVVATESDSELAELVKRAEEILKMEQAIRKGAFDKKIQAMQAEKAPL